MQTPLMVLLVSFGILLLAGFLTVVTEAFTRFAVVGSLWETLRELALQSLFFSFTALFWSLTVWLGLRWIGEPVDLLPLAELLGAAHLPLLAYPLTIFPTVGFRLAQILRLLVYLIFTTNLVLFTPVTALPAAIVCLPGWLVHFLLSETHLFRGPR